jgi:hypothetical protein
MRLMSEEEQGRMGNPQMRSTGLPKECEHKLAYRCTGVIDLGAGETTPVYEEICVLCHASRPIGIADVIHLAGFNILLEKILGGVRGNAVKVVADIDRRLLIMNAGKKGDPERDDRG